jgi:CheY-like chemotaxis protein
MARSVKPDLIIVDVRLPDGDGIELTRQLRAERETSEVPIICVSSYLQGLEAEALAVGCDAAFSKTTFIETYRETLARYLGDHRSVSSSVS